MIPIVQVSCFITENERQMLKSLVSSSIMPHLSIFNDKNEEDAKLLKIIFAMQYGESIFSRPMQQNVLKICDRIKNEIKLHIQEYKLHKDTMVAKVFIEALTKQIVNVNEIYSIFVEARPNPDVTIPAEYEFA